MNITRGHEIYFSFFAGPTLTDDEKQELEEIRSFRHQTLQLYLTTLDGRTSWSTLIQVLIYLQFLTSCNFSRL